MPTFERLALAAVDRPALDAFADRTFSQRRHWLEFFAARTGGEPAVARLDQGGQTRGFFSGVLFHRLGVPILGIAFRGWTTPIIGFNLESGMTAAEALPSLERFAFGELGCLHLELSDRQLAVGEGARQGFAERVVQTFLTDLRPDAEQLFANMTRADPAPVRDAPLVRAPLLAGARHPPPRLGRRQRLQGQVRRQHLHDGRVAQIRLQIHPVRPRRRRAGLPFPRRLHRQRYDAEIAAW